MFRLGKPSRGRAGILPTYHHFVSLPSDLRKGDTCMRLGPLTLLPPYSTAPETVSYCFAAPLRYCDTCASASTSQLRHRVIAPSRHCATAHLTLFYCTTASPANPKTERGFLSGGHLVNKRLRRCVRIVPCHGWRLCGYHGDAERGHVSVPPPRLVRSRLLDPSEQEVSSKGVIDDPKCLGGKVP